LAQRSRPSPTRPCILTDGKRIEEAIGHSSGSAAGDFDATEVKAINWSCSQIAPIGIKALIRLLKDAIRQNASENLKAWAQVRKSD